MKEFRPAKKRVEVSGEGLIAKWERYASLVLSGDVPTTARREGNLRLVSGVDYGIFKLFQLSILWRAGTSSLPFFSKVRLGHHQEQLRRLLLRQDPGSRPNMDVSCTASCLRAELTVS